MVGRVTMRSVGTEGRRPGTATLALGSGWVWPAVLLTLVVSFIYLPAHHRGVGAGDGFIAALGGLYAIGLSVVLPRLVRGGILRPGGSRDPIVLLGRGSDPLVSAAIGPRWRLAAVGGGLLMSTAAALGSAVLVGVSDPATYAHALTTLVLGANIALAAATVVPVPGFAGWAVLLALVDAAGIGADQRIRRAGRVAQTIGVPGFLLAGAGAALLGDPMMLPTGLLLAMFTRTQTDLAVGRDATARFLQSHEVGDVAWPVMSHADAAEPVDDLVARLTEAAVVTLVETSGALVGAIGPRQLDGRDRVRRGQRCSELMVPLSNLPLLSGSTPAAGLLSEVGRYGFALVRASDGLTYVEAGDLLERIQAWVATTDDRPIRRPATQSAGSSPDGIERRRTGH